MSDAAARSSLPSESYLSPAEWRVFSVLAKKGRAMTIRQLVDELARSSDKNRGYTTILTLAQRLVAKGYFTEGARSATVGRGSAISYSIAVPYEEALQRHTERFLAQFANGREDLSLVSAVVTKQLAIR